MAVRDTGCTAGSSSKTLAFHTAPSLIHASTAASAAGSSCFLGGMWGSLPLASTWKRRLSRPFPAITEGPLSPPLSIFSCVFRISPPLALPGLWQPMHSSRSTRIAGSVESAWVPRVLRMKRPQVRERKDMEKHTRAQGLLLHSGGMARGGPAAVTQPRKRRPVRAAFLWI